MKKEIKTQELQTKARYFEGVGRRKTAIARVRVTNGVGGVVVNERKAAEYFPLKSMQKVFMEPLVNLKMADTLGVSVKVKGGGLAAQADAVRHGLARALVLLNPEFQKRLRTLGFLTRDPRMVERKKYGLKKARRAPQWAKR